MLSDVLSHVEKHPLLWLLGLICAVSAGVFAPSGAIGAMLIMGMIGVMARWNTWAVVVLVALGAGREIFINVANNEDLRRIPFVGSLYAPMVDFYAIALMVSFALLLVLKYIRTKEWQPLRFPGGFVFIAFLFAGSVSALWAWNDEVMRSLYALVRGPFFAYCAFFLLPIGILKHRRDLIRVLIAWMVASGVGVMLGIVGWVRLVVQGSIPRLEPVALGWFSPFGVNHNLLGEVLVVACAWSLALSFLQVHRARLWWICAGICFGAGVLTLGRSTWIMLALQVVGAGMLLYRQQIKAFFHGREWYALFVLPVVGYMVYFSQTWAVTSSNSARLAITDIALTYFSRRPFFGWGPGMFMDIMGSTRAFTLEFGSPLEAHGMLQKLLPEYGLVGTILFIVFLCVICARMVHGYMLARAEDKPALFFILLGAWGVVGYQLFNVSYFNSKMWIPLAIGYASAHIIHMRGKD